MEFKSCEEYVLNELVNAQSKIAEKESNIEHLTLVIKSLTDEMKELMEKNKEYEQFIKELSGLFTISTSTETLKFNDEAVYPWYEDRKVLYDKIVKMFNLKLNEESEN